MIVLRKYLELNFKALHYDGQQFYSLLSEFLALESTLDDPILIKWKESIKNLTETYLERLNIDRKMEKSDLSYDLITNLPGKGFFVISLSTEREEICVWDAST